MSVPALPSVEHTYKSALMDSTRWEHFTPRDGDIVITTSYKAGTTWMQAICAALIFQAPQPPVPQDDLTPWLDARFAPIADVIALLEGLESRRYIKTHLPLDALIYYPQLRYIFVGRDGMDVWMSMWNHWHNMTPEAIAELNEAPDREGPELLPAPDDIHAAFDEWLSRASFPWEQDGYPFWSHLHHAQSWWRFRALPNLLCVHFNDLKRDLDGEMRRVAAFLGIPVDEAIWPELMAGVGFERMKANATHMAPGGTREIWKDPRNFFHKGDNRRWQNLLSEDAIRHYREHAAKVLEPELAHWLEHGGPV